MHALAQPASGVARALRPGLQLIVSLSTLLARDLRHAAIPPGGRLRGRRRVP